MRRRVWGFLLALLLLAGCTQPVPSSEEAEQPVSQSLPEQASEPHGPIPQAAPEEETLPTEATAPPEYAHKGRAIALTRISAQEVGLTPYPEHAVGGYRPAEAWLCIADGSQPYTDAHFAAGIRHGQDYPFMRSSQRDLILFLPAYTEPVIADIRVGDSMAATIEKLGAPTLDEFKKLNDEAILGFAIDQYPDESFPTFRFLHYKGEGFYLSFMGVETIKMIGIKRLPPVDYPLDLLATWQDTLLSHGADATLESRDAFFDRLQFFNWSGGFSISNKGLHIWDGVDTTLYLYNDFQGYIYAETYVDDGSRITDANFEEENSLYYYPFANKITFVNKDSNMEALTTYMGSFYMLERQLSTWPSPSPGGKYIATSESLRPYNYQYCLRSTDLQHRDILFDFAPDSFIWLDDRSALLYSRAFGGVHLRSIDNMDWESEDILSQLGLDHVQYPVSAENGRIVFRDGYDDANTTETVILWRYNTDGAVCFSREDGTATHCAPILPEEQTASR